MKNRMLIYIITLILILTSCRARETYAFLGNESEISGISVVAITIDSGANVSSTELIKIEDVDTFLEEFKAVDCYTYRGDPVGITEDCNAIMIQYSSGEYELISWNGQAEYTLDRGFRNYVGYSVFDEEAFSNLINSNLPGSS